MSRLRDCFAGKKYAQLIKRRINKEKNSSLQKITYRVQLLCNIGKQLLDNISLVITVSSARCVRRVIREDCV